VALLAIFAVAVFACVLGFNARTVKKIQREIDQLPS
jgi:hypothetical protein